MPGKHRVALSFGGRTREDLERAFASVINRPARSFLERSDKLGINPQALLGEGNQRKVTRGIRGGREHSGRGPRGFPARLLAVEDYDFELLGGQFKGDGAADDSPTNDRDIEVFHGSDVISKSRRVASVHPTYRENSTPEAHHFHNNNVGSRHLVNRGLGVVQECSTKLHQAR